MTRFALASVCFLVLAGCGGDLHSRLIGKWQFDAEALAGDAYKNLSATDKKGMEQAMGSMALTITEDSITVQGMNLKYTVKEQSGDKIVIETTDSKNAKQEVTFNFDGDTLLLNMGGQKIPLKKQ